MPSATSYYARYYAFISKYLDSTDLSSFVGLPRFSSPDGGLLPGSLARPSALVFPLHAHSLTIPPSLALLSPRAFLRRAHTLSLSFALTTSGFSSCTVCPTTGFLPPRARITLLRTCQSRAAVAATHRILDTQYPSCLPEGAADIPFHSSFHRSCCTHCKRTKRKNAVLVDVPPSISLNARA